MVIKKLLLQRFTRLATGANYHAHAQHRFLDRVKEDVEDVLGILPLEYVETHPGRATLEECAEFDLWWKDFERKCAAVIAKHHPEDLHRFE